MADVIDAVAETYPMMGEPNMLADRLNAAANRNALSVVEVSENMNGSQRELLAEVLDQSEALRYSRAVLGSLAQRNGAFGDFMDRQGRGGQMVPLAVDLTPHEFARADGGELPRDQFGARERDTAREQTGARAPGSTAGQATASDAVTLFVLSGSAAGANPTTRGDQGTAPGTR